MPFIGVGVGICFGRVTQGSSVRAGLANLARRADPLGWSTRHAEIRLVAPKANEGGCKRKSDGGGSEGWLVAPKRSEGGQPGAV
jgi:hypothetical protein